MFNNIGKKIKIVTVISFITLCVCSIIAGIVSMVVYDDWKLYLVLILCVPFLLWISSFYAYGFGELIENTTKIKNTLQKDGSDKQTEAENDIEEDVDIEENIYAKINRFNSDLEDLEKRVIRDTDYDSMKKEMTELNKRYLNIENSLPKEQREFYMNEINNLTNTIERLSK
ncbi:MAG: hypothetical protein PUI94_06885 [Eubacteriales bacterium]|nr:hypothetical protein [Eubacteriales bacterium]